MEHQSMDIAQVYDVPFIIYSYGLSVLGSLAAGTRVLRVRSLILVADYFS
jgi:hypothetical protein